MRSIARVLRLAALRPILDFIGKVGTRLVSKVIGDIERTLIGEPALALRKARRGGDRHVRLDGAGGGAGARHACADVEGVLGSQRRNPPVAVGRAPTRAFRAVADGALRLIERLAALGSGVSSAAIFAVPRPGNLPSVTTGAFIAST